MSCLRSPGCGVGLVTIEIGFGGRRRARTGVLWAMPDNELLYALIGIAVAVFATVAAWIEARVERRDAAPHRKVLKANPRYKRHMERRR